MKVRFRVNTSGEAIEKKTTKRSKISGHIQGVPLQLTLYCFPFSLFSILSPGGSKPTSGIIAPAIFFWRLCGAEGL